ncbi:MAG: 30S ribosome-binding factor RbfA [Pirellulales bacterium]|nr:30S ribosome-binding factor RbfA [Planctomycetales bacterium]
MTSRRVLKAAEAVREVVSMAILTELKDPRVRDVTVTRVEMSGDMRQAKVYVSVMGDEGHQRLTLQGLKSSAGYLQSRVAERIDTRYTPRLQFILDEGVKKSIEVARILREVLPRETTDDTGTNENDEIDEGEPDEEVADEEAAS